ncbi:MAG: asparagine synthase (glutamine-hydrolyzing), partial [Bacteroidota bacterium]|nr:asparagine synthase (glutamine-hydrolyzing) [Bacteroidota bacterium]
MCGLAGIASFNTDSVVPAGLVKKMCDVIAHRGPDDSGEASFEGCTLGSRRLAILDLSPLGHMPMDSPSGRYSMAYNGETYNFQELKANLQAKGHSFISGTDTEVILHLYEEYGAAMLDMLNGMFAIAIWDKVERSLFIARDRLGIKPLYYAVSENKLYFASEEKALFAAGIEPVFDHSTWHELLYFRYVTGENTPFKGIKRLLPGHWMTLKNGRISFHRWWKLSEEIKKQRETPIRDPEAWFRETFDSAVALRKISDVPVGVLLSGGLDSASVAASMAINSSRPVSSFTVRFNEKEYDESSYAK